MMNDKGFIFTMDAVLALIPIFIVLGSISTISYDGTQFAAVPLGKQANDVVQILTLGDSPLINQYLNDTTVTRLGDPLSKIEGILNDTISYSYLLEYNLNQGGNWNYIVGRSTNGSVEATVRASLGSAEDVYTAERIVFNSTSTSNVTTRIYLWNE